MNIKFLEKLFLALVAVALFGAVAAGISDFQPDVASGKSDSHDNNNSSYNTLYHSRLTILYVINASSQAIAVE